MVLKPLLSFSLNQTLSDLIFPGEQSLKDLQRCFYIYSLLQQSTLNLQFADHHCKFFLNLSLALMHKAKLFLADYLFRVQLLPQAALLKQAFLQLSIVLQCHLDYHKLFLIHPEHKASTFLFQQDL